MDMSGDRRSIRHEIGALCVITMAVVASAIGASMTGAQRPPACNLVPQLRDVTVNQGVGAYSPLVNGKETLVRFFLSMPSCAGSGASIQITAGTLTLSGGASGTVSAPTPVPQPTAYPIVAAFTAAPMADSTGDPKFVVPGAMVSRTTAFTATFSTTLSYRAKATKSGTYGAIQQITFSNRPGTSTPISTNFDRPSNALGVLFVPMGDGTKTYSTQWTAAAQQALQDGMTAAVARQYPLPAGIGNLGGTGGLRYMVTPTLLDLNRLNLLSAGKFCGTGANYDLIKAELAQFRLSHNTANPNAQANRVVGVVDPAVGLGPPSPCFEGMAVVNSQEAWALARAGRAGQLIGLELAHTLGLTPPNRESPFDGAHSQNVAAENPSVNRRYNVVQRSFIVTDRSLMKPSATSPSPDNVNTLLEVPDYAFLLCVFGGTPITECLTHGPGTVNASEPVAATLSFVMSGSTTGTAGICVTCTGPAAGTSVVESYFASTVPQTSPVATSEYRLVQRAAGGAVLSNLGVPVSFRHSEHGTGSGSTTHSSGLFSFVLPFQSTADRIELWKGAPGGSGSLLLYAQNRTAAPQVTGLSVGSEITLARRPSTSARILATFSVTNTNDSGAGSLRQAILDANGSAGADSITFAIGTGPQTIAPTSALPTITDLVTIDGTTQPGFSGAPIIELSGASAPADNAGLHITAGSSTVRGLVINRFVSSGAAVNSPDGEAIHLETGDGNVIEGNHLGTDIAGAADLGNHTGVHISGSSTSNRIGGAAADARNIISGNNRFAIYHGGLSTASVIENNFIGLNRSGNAAVANATGINFNNGGDGSTIRNNMISGNTGAAIIVGFSENILIQGNRIGTDPLGTTAIPNSTGIQILAGATTSGPASNNVIGGTGAGQGNLIAGNGGPGILMNSFGAPNGTTGNQIIGNRIGVSETGGDLGNAGAGIALSGPGMDSTTIGGTGPGAGNVIAFNAFAGIAVAPGNVRERILENSIYSNDGLGIDLGDVGVTPNDPGDTDSGSNDLQNFPVLTSAEAQGGSVRIQGTLSSTPSTTFRLDFYASMTCDPSDFGEGERWIGWAEGLMTTTNASGDASFDTGSGLTAPTSPGEWVTATATDPSGNTSEFSECVQITGGGGGTQPGPTFTVNTNSDGTPADAGCTTPECTLREAMTAANAQAGSNTIEFDIGGDTQIALQDALPSVTSPVLIDGLSQPEGTIVINGDGAGAEVNGLQLATGSGGSEIRGLEIRDFFSGAGISIVSADNTIASNTIHSVNDGTVISGATATGNVIGDDVGPSELALVDYALGNVLVQADGSGLEILDGATGTVVAGNFIGTDRTGSTDRGNGSNGIHVDGASNNQLGPGNTVARNGSIDTGIEVESGSGNRIVANSIHHNLGKGISLFEGANGDLREPTLTSATSSGGSTTVSGSIGGLGVSDGQYFVELFENAACDTPGGSGEGETFLTFTTVTASGGTGGSFTASVSGLSVGDVVTATLTRASGPADTSEFSNCVTVEEAETLPPGQESWSASGSDADNIADATLDGYIDCGDGLMQVVFVGRRPDSVSGNTAHWSGTIDTSLAPAGCEFKVAIMDQFTRPPITPTGTETVNNGPNPVVAAISSPRDGATILQYGLIPLRGLILNAEGVLAGSAHQWEVDGPGTFTRSGTGTIVDLQPPSGGWPAGSYEATLTTPGGGGSGTDTVNFTVLTDADNDGVPKTIEDSCLGGGDDDPTNADDDKDNDGLPNVNDPQPCVAATSYTAIVEINPDPLPTGSSGSPITAFVRVPGRNIAQVLASSVRITRIADQDVSTNNDFRNTAWTISGGVGTAKFDRQKLIQHLAARNIHNSLVSITVSGRSGAPPWNFEGSDTIFVQG
jgi:Right handed beta helix region